MFLFLRLWLATCYDGVSKMEKSETLFGMYEVIFKILVCIGFEIIKNPSDEDVSWEFWHLLQTNVSEISIFPSKT